MLNADRIGAGQFCIGPRGVAAQSIALMAAPVSPPGSVREVGLMREVMGIY